MVFLEMPGSGCSAVVLTLCQVLFEMRDPIWVLTGFEHALFSAWDCDKLLALLLGTVQPISGRGKGVKPKNT